MRNQRVLSHALLALILLATPASAQLQPGSHALFKPQSQPLLLGQPKDSPRGFPQMDNSRMVFRKDQAMQFFQDSSGGGALRTPESYGQTWRATRTVGLSLAFNGVMTLFGRYIMKSTN